MKRIKYVILFFLILICCGCSYKYASTTREIRHSGFAVSNSSFKCSPVISENGDSDKVKFYIGNYFITDNGTLYETSLSQLYSNDMNCNKPDFPTKVSAIFDMSIVKGIDNKYYYLKATENTPGYTEVPSSDQDYMLYDILLKDSSVLKVVTVNSKSGIYYVLKSDGNVYQYNIIKDNNSYYLDRTSIVYSKNNFGSRIVDFNYNGSSTTTFIKTGDSYYRMLVTNSEECYKYADVSCEYSLKEDEGLRNSFDRIEAYNGSTLITTYGKIFNVTN